MAIIMIVVALVAIDVLQAKHVLKQVKQKC